VIDRKNNQSTFNRLDEQEFISWLEDFGFTFQNIEMSMLDLIGVLGLIGVLVTAYGFAGPTRFITPIPANSQM